jgi:hypothetical protein
VKLVIAGGAGAVPGSGGDSSKAKRAPRSLLGNFRVFDIYSIFFLDDLIHHLTMSN